MKNWNLSFLFVAILLIVSCGDDANQANNCNTQFAQSFEDELEAVSQASTNFGMDPSTENCEAFKQAYIDYLDALEGWEECAVINNQVEQWEQSIDAARAAAEDIEC